MSSPSSSAYSLSHSSSDEATDSTNAQEDEGSPYDAGSVSHIPVLSIEQGTESADDEDGGGSDYSDSVKSESESDVEIHRINRKRSLESAFSEASTNAEHRAQPRKRMRRALNPRYVDLLNDDIEDARRRYVPDGWPQLNTTQAGVTVWEEEEKELLYEAIARLGRDDVPGIAKRLSTKSEVEVRHYLHLLREDAHERRSAVRDPLLPPPLAEFPAAVETGSACCAALDVEADLVVQREAREEAKSEQRRWGQHWLVTGASCSDLTRAALASAGVAADDEASNRSMSPMPVSGGEAASADGMLAQMQNELRPEAVPALSLLNTPYMLLLSERVFMNGVAKEDNYIGLGSEMPALHMSAVRDMYELVYSLTQRLVATAVHMSQSRDRTQQTDSFKRMTRNVVHPSDVDAAVLSLGLKSNALEFWARCPRRLGLRVSESASAFFGMHEYRTTSSHASGDYDEDSDIMAYSEVERLLGRDQTAIAPGTVVPPEAETAEDEADDDDGSSDDDTDDTEERINLEAEEITSYSATGFPDVSWARHILKNRIGDELKEEAYADAVDKHKSSADELYLWKVLGKKPPPSSGLNSFDESKPPEIAGFSATAKRFPVEQIIDTGRNWREKLQYEAEWEDDAAEVQLLAYVAEDHDTVG